MSLRLFTGIEIDSQASQLIYQMCSSLSIQVKWVPIENYHITLKFLGSCQEDLVPDIVSSLNIIAGRVEPFSYFLSRTGVFPSIKRPRVLWVGVKQGIEEFSRLALETEKILQELGFTPENRKFHPHLTLARLKKPIAIDEFLESTAYKAWEEIENKVLSINLYQSILSPKGAVYQVKKRISIL